MYMGDRAGERVGERGFEEHAGRLPKLLYSILKVDLMLPLLFLVALVSSDLRRFVQRIQHQIGLHHLSPLLAYKTSLCLLRCC